MAVGHHHREPVDALELLDQEAGRRQKGQTQDEVDNGDKDTRKRHGLPSFSPALQTRADYLRLRSFRLVHGWHPRRSVGVELEARRP